MIESRRPLVLPSPTQPESTDLIARTPTEALPRLADRRNSAAPRPWPVQLARNPCGAGQNPRVAADKPWIEAAWGKGSCAADDLGDCCAEHLDGMQGGFVGDGSSGVEHEAVDTEDFLPSEDLRGNRLRVAQNE